MNVAAKEPAIRGRVALVTQGCKVNQYESQVLLEEFLARGWESVPFGEAADLVLINSCTVTAGSDRDLRRLVNRARRAAPAGRILVTGCRAQVDAAGARAIPGVDYVYGNTLKEKIPALATAAALESGGDAGEHAGFGDRIADGPITRLDGRGRALLKIQDGCNLRCSFCIVPLARGDSRSRSAADALRRARSLAAHGYREIVLSGIQLGFYSDPDGQAKRLADLLALLLAGTEGLRFRLGSLLPRHVTPELIALFASEPRRLCPHFHLSLQSGEDGVLKAMKRPYRSESYRRLLQELSARIESPCFGTDLIVGFPGEDERAFEACRDFVAASPLSYGHVFPFSPRAGTRAAGLGDPVPGEEKARRSRILRKLLAEKGEAYRRRQLGRRLRAVAEKQRPDGRWQGTSENYQRLVFTAPQLRFGQIVELEVSGLEDGSLVGSVPVGAEALERQA